MTKVKESPCRRSVVWILLMFTQTAFHSVLSGWRHEERSLMWLLTKDVIFTALEAELRSVL